MLQVFHLKTAYWFCPRLWPFNCCVPSAASNWLLLRVGPLRSAWRKWPLPLVRRRQCRTSGCWNRSAIWSTKWVWKAVLWSYYKLNLVTNGTADEILHAKDKVTEEKEFIVVALDLSQSLVTWDNAKFITASVSMQKMMVKSKKSNRPPANGSASTNFDAK